jgi:hypothetical protein
VNSFGHAVDLAWKADALYKTGHLVTRAGVAYFAIADSQNKQPPDAGYWAAVGGGAGGGTTIYSGKAEVSFGAFPGGFEATAVITGQTAILATSRLAAWVDLLASGDHSADEHRIEQSLVVRAGNIVPGTGFTIYAACEPWLQEPLRPVGPDRLRLNAAPAMDSPLPSIGGAGLRLYGAWNVVWQYWN